MISFLAARRLFTAMAATLTVFGCATFTGEIPIELDPADTRYISPLNGDGIQDVLFIPLEIPQIAGLIVQGYQFTVFDAAGGAVYTESAEAEAKQRNAAIDIPDQITWSGITDSGEYVPDGEYSYTVEAWDRRGNRGATMPRFVVVDNTPPYIELYASFPLFSPNGDGRLDEVLIRQLNSSVEDEWTGEISSETNMPVRGYLWEGMAPDFSWDGKDDSGKLVPDGVYSYRMASTDRAGNTSVYVLSELTIDAEPTPISLELESKAFSPNGDGIKDILTLIPKATVARNIDSWLLEIYDSLGTVRRTVTGVQPVPASLDFDGMDDSGARLADGIYRGSLTVNYRNGDAPMTGSPTFALDTVKPIAALSAPYVLFSPNGDGRKDILEILQSTTSELMWQGYILDSARRPVKSYTWRGRAAPLIWEGKNDSGAIVPDGVYSYEITSTDAAGNSTAVRLTSITVDRKPTPITVSLTVRSFSPNGDGVLDSAAFEVAATILDGILQWKLDIMSAASVPVRTFGGSERVPARIVWDGRTADGRVVEGNYKGKITVEYRKGNVASATTLSSLLLDVSPPVMRIASSPTPFSPDNDGTDDRLVISINATDASSIQEWSAVISDPMGNAFKKFSGTSAPPRTIVWDGLSDNGELVQSVEDYNMAFSARDSVWNRGFANHVIPVDILVMKEGNRLRIVISSIYFKSFTADYLSIDADQAENNLKTLDRLAQVLNKYNKYQITLEGHAVRVYWNDPRRIETEEREVLLPLSQERADVIKQALVERGIAKSRMTTEGFGGSRPVVPHSDEDNRWKNRRVEFVLVRTQ